MSEVETSDQPLAESSKRFVKRLLALGSTRVELMLLEVEEERRHLLHTTILALIAGILALLCVLGLSAAIVVVFWNTHPIAALLALSTFYGVMSVILFQRVVAMRRDWKILPATIEQFKKDGECLEKILS